MKIRFTFLLIYIFYSSLSTYAQWESIGPYGGYIRCLIKDNQGRVLSGNAYGGIFRTSDAGQNWNQIFTGYRNEDVRSLAVNSNNHIFAGTDLRGLYRSTNDGISWERLNNSVSTRTILDILIKSSGDIFLGTFNGVYRSTDNGTTFSTASNGITTSSIYSLGLSGNYIFAGTNGAGIFRSSDDGANWEVANTGINLSDGIVWDFVSAEGTDNVGAAKIHALTQNNLYHSINSGGNWNGLSLPTGLYVDVLIRNNDNIVVVGSQILNSVNQGGIWTNYTSPSVALISSIVEIDNNTLMAGTQGPGTYVSTNNLADWNLEVKKMPATAITGISTTAGVINVSTRHSGVFNWDDITSNWNNLSSSLPNGWIYGLYQHPTTNTFFALHQNGVYRSVNGTDWDLTSAFGKTMEFNSLGNIFLGGGSFISKSTNDGVSYQLKQISSNVFSSLDIAINQNDEMIIATANDFGLQGQGVYKSIDLGETYFPYNVGLPLNITSVEAVNTTGFPIVFDCIKKLVAADANGNFYSNNEDGSWNQFNIGLQLGGLVKDIAAINYVDGIKISAITEREMFEIDDQSSCSFEAVDIDDDAVLTTKIRLHRQVLFNKSENQIIDLVGTVGIGILRKQFPTGNSDLIFSIPSKYALNQNYPNPFNPNTKINWQSPVGTHQTLKVYDVLGNEVVTLVNEYKPAGNFEVEFDAVNLPSGVYLCKLNSGAFVKTIKMVLIK